MYYIIEIIEKLYFFEILNVLENPQILSNMNSDFTSVITVRNIGSQYLLFVASEQVLDRSALSEYSTRRD